MFVVDESVVMAYVGLERRFSGQSCQVPHITSPNSVEYFILYRSV